MTKILPCFIILTLVLSACVSKAHAREPQSASAAPVLTGVTSADTAAALADNNNTTADAAAPVLTGVTSADTAAALADNNNTTADAAEPEDKEDKEDKEDNNADWRLMIISKANPLPEGYKVTTKVVGKSAFGADISVDKRVAPSAKALLAAAKKAGLNLVITSGYRSVEKQKENREAYFKDYTVNQHMDAEQAQKLVDMYVARPGESEHNAGICMDVITADWFKTHNELNEKFEQTSEFKWLQDNAYKYGFILRYLKGKKDVTGFEYEPWHYRYVGKENAKAIWNNGDWLTLEDYAASKAE